MTKGILTIALGSYRPGHSGRGLHADPIDGGESSAPMLPRHGHHALLPPEMEDSVPIGWTHIIVVSRLA